jgi:hypothetical protein
MAALQGRVMKPLAVAATITMKVVNGAVQSGGETPEGGRHSPLELNPIIPILRAMGFTFEAKEFPPTPEPPGVPVGLRPEDVAQQKKREADTGREEYEAIRNADPGTHLAEERRKLAELDKKVEHGSPADVKAAAEQFQLVKRLEQSGKGNTATNKGLEDVIAARKQGFELDDQFAEIQLANKTNEMSARLETRKGFSTPEDIEERLGLATLVVDAKQTLEIEKRRKVVDTKTGRELDMSNDPGFKRFKAAEEELRPKLIRNEFEKILGKANG